MFSACITSIVRTYYSWKIIHSQDVTYDLFQMGLWNYAEISIGIMVSCLPVSPRFFQFIGPKIYGTFTRLASETKVDSSLSPSAFKQKNVSTKFKRLVTRQSNSEAWDDPYGPQVQLKAESFGLTHQDLRSTECDSTRGSVPTLHGRQALTSDDLDSKQSGIRVDHTTQIEIAPNTSNTTSSNLVEQQMKRGW